MLATSLIVRPPTYAASIVGLFLKVVFGGNLSNICTITHKLVGWLILPVLCKQQSAWGCTFWVAAISKAASVSLAWGRVGVFLLLTLWRLSLSQAALRCREEIWMSKRHLFKPGLQDLNPELGMRSPQWLSPNREGELQLWFPACVM